ncbi:MAG: hypothetical protein A2Y10_05915 [Planctomycetes bacterium GWF2_41_51]|nr:MAG: hypothetical protein A2Y10_05915 [Planctomycetes bacterium GWF2_41_51]
MTELEARQIMGINDNAGFDETKQVYEKTLQKLRNKIVPGNDMSVRHEAERKITQLITAWESLKRTYAGASHQQSMPQYASAPAYTSINQKQIEIAGIWIAGFFMLIILIVCMSAYSNYKQKRMAQFRVLSVPWCDVELDGRKIGQSGQIEAFKVMEGKHYLVLRSNEKLIDKYFKIKRRGRLLIKVNFDRRTVYVSNE